MSNRWEEPNCLRCVDHPLFGFLPSPLGLTASIRTATMLFVQSADLIV
jgi:hypothetical protein